MKRVTSADNPRYRVLRKLSQSARERRKAGLTLLDGVHLLSAYAAGGAQPVDIAVSATGAVDPEIAGLLARLAPLQPLLLTDALFATLSTVATPTGIVASVPTPQPTLDPVALDACVWLEDIQDPGNLGSILRSAAAAGVRQVCLSKTSAQAWSPRVLRAGMGAHFLLDIYEDCDLVALAHDFGGRVLAASGSAPRSVFDCDLRGRVALLFGNEGAGVSPALRALVSEAVAIPMPGAMESPNVAAAAAICLFERVRQGRGQ